MGERTRRLDDCERAFASDEVTLGAFPGAAVAQKTPPENAAKKLFF